MESLYSCLKTLPPGYRFAPTDEELIFYLGSKVLVKSSVPGEEAVIRDINAHQLYSCPPNEIEMLWRMENGEWVSWMLLSCILNLEDPRRERGEWYFFIHIDEHQKKQEGKENIPLAGNSTDFWTSFGKKEAFHERKGNGNGGKKEKWSHFDENKQENFRIVGNGIGFWRSVGKEHPIYDVNGNVFAFKIHLIYFSGSKKTHWRMEEYHLVASDEQDLQKEEWVLGRITRGRDYSYVLSH